jgi:hypothetical protein
MKSQFEGEHRHLEKLVSKEEIGHVAEFLKYKKAAALDIDLKTTEVYWDYRYMHDPYSVIAKPVREYDEQYGWVMLEVFARSRGGVWVWLGDVPKRVGKILEKRAWGSIKVPDGFFNDA